MSRKKTPNAYSMDLFGNEFHEFANAYSRKVLGINELNWNDQKLFEDRILTVTRFFNRPQYDNRPNLRLALKNHPAKVWRINRLVRMINKSDSRKVVKQIINELERLIKGENTPLPFPEEEFGPQFVAFVPKQRKRKK